MAMTSEEPAAPPGRISRGNVFWVAPDVEGTTQSPHLHVVVMDDVFNHSRVATVIVCGPTTNLHRASEPGNVLLDVGEGDLPTQSVVVVSQVSSVEKARLGGRIGSLSAERVGQILAGPRFLQAKYIGR
jgi:mRNA interferase MazF